MWQLLKVLFFHQLNKNWLMYFQRQDETSLCEWWLKCCIYCDVHDRLLFYIKPTTCNFEESMYHYVPICPPAPCFFWKNRFKNPKVSCICRYNVLVSQPHCEHFPVEILFSVKTLAGFLNYPDPPQHQKFLVKHMKTRCCDNWIRHFSIISLSHTNSFKRSVFQNFNT